MQSINLNARRQPWQRIVLDTQDVQSQSMGVWIGQSVTGLQYVAWTSNRPVTLCVRPFGHSLWVESLSQSSTSVWTAGWFQAHREIMDSDRWPMTWKWGGGRRTAVSFSFLFLSHCFRPRNWFRCRMFCTGICVIYIGWYRVCVDICAKYKHTLRGLKLLDQKLYPAWNMRATWLVDRIICTVAACVGGRRLVRNI